LFLKFGKSSFTGGGCIGLVMVGGRKRRRAEAHTSSGGATRGESRVEAKAELKENKYSYKIEKTAGKAQLIDAKARRLKWLCILLGMILMLAGAWKLKLFGG
jgi:hypothetical protein